jgi:hypothetical protein
VGHTGDKKALRSGRTMFGGPVTVSNAQDDGGGVTLASLAGRFASRGNGFFTLCFNSNFSALVDCASSPPHVLPFNQTCISHSTLDAAGNSCGVQTCTSAPVFGTTFPADVTTRTNVGTTISFDPTTGSGTATGKQYVGGSCNGAVFDITGATKVADFTTSFDVSDSGNRIETILKTYNAVTSAFSVAGSVKGAVFSATSIRQHPQD